MRDATDLGRPVEGVLWMLATTLLFVGVNGIVRHLGTEIPAAQSAFIRFVFGLVILAPAIWSARDVRFPAATWKLFCWRGALHVAAVIFWFWAMARVPVAEMAAIGFLNPVIVLVLAALLMGEGFQRGRVLAVVVALAGALVVLRPGLREVTPGHLAQLAATLFFAVSYIFAKRLSVLAPASVVVAVLSVTVAVGLAPIALWVWQPVSGVQLAWLAGRRGGAGDSGALHDDAGVSGRAAGGDAAGGLPADPVGKPSWGAGLWRAGGCLRHPGRGADRGGGQPEQLGRGAARAPATLAGAMTPGVLRDPAGGARGAMTALRKLP
jgi:uncharacterized membrane protein